MPTPLTLSWIESLPASQAQQALAELRNLPPDDKAELLYRWEFWRRPLVTHPDGTYGGQEPPPGDWRVWLILAGRGYGKSWTGAQLVRHKVETAQASRIALVGETAADVRDVMVEGESGILAISSPDCKPEYQPSKRRLVWPNGAIATTFSGDAPDQLRGPNHDFAWADEPAKWKYPDDAWSNMEFGVRLGVSPQIIATTTPRPIKLIKELMGDPSTAITVGSTFENAGNLAPAFIARMRKKYEGTRLGMQELYARILDDNPGALWKRSHLDTLRVTQYPDLVRVVVAIDPATTSSEGSDETGIIGAGIGADSHGYILEDASLRGTPLQWATAAVTLYHKLQADCIVAEANQGGEMVEFTIHTVDPNVPVKLVHASRGKVARAEPVAALYEHNPPVHPGTVHHLGNFADLEDQMCNWVQGDASPDRLDALVWALTELMLKPQRDWGFDDV